MITTPSSPVFFDLSSPTPIGKIGLAIRANRVVAVTIETEAASFAQTLTRQWGSAEVQIVHAPQEVASFIGQIEEYLHGDRLSLEMRIAWEIFTPYQASVLRLVQFIPYGETRTYSEIARELGNVNASRAVGRANATNPVPLVIPCHRVISQKNELCGYLAPNGVATKAWLLQLEGSLPAKQRHLL